MSASSITARLAAGLATRITAGFAPGRAAALAAGLKAGTVASLAAVFTMTGCASYPTSVRVGEPAFEVRARLGAPADAVKRADGERLIYPLGPFGQQTYLIEVGADGRVNAVTPALTDARFALIEKGRWDKTQVRQEFGPPAETGAAPLKKHQVWSYRYKREGVWDALMHVHFDGNGIVQDYYYTRDPMFEPDEEFIPLLGRMR
jgi:hypothetical protein